MEEDILNYSPTVNVWDTLYIILREPHRMRQKVRDNDDDIQLFKGTVWE